MIRERRPGVFEVRVYVGVDAAGRRRHAYRTVTGRPGDLKVGRRAESDLLRDYPTVEALDAALEAEKRRADENPARITVAQLVDRWLDHAAPELGITTVDGYRKYQRLYIAPRLGNVPLTRLTPKKIDDFYNALRQPGGAHRRKNGLSATTVHHCHAVLRRALAQAVKWEWIETNPADRASPPKMRPKPLTIPSLEEVVNLVNAAPPTFALLLWVAAVTGARRGELCALRWSDIDFAEGSVTIARAVIEDRVGYLHEKDTKTHASRRIALDDAMIELLEAHRTAADRLAGELDTIRRDDAHVFLGADPTGDRPLAPGLVSKRFQRLCDAVGISCRFHDLRHFHATELIGSGVDVRTVSGRLGHASARMTLDVYSHALPARDRSAAGILGAALETERRRPGR